MKQNILDSALYPVSPKAFEGVKNDYFILLWEFGAKTPKQL